MTAENDNTTSRFELDGVEYEVPDFTDLDLDDWQLVYDECSVVLADFAPDEDPAAETARRDRLRNPRLEKSFLMIGYLRKHPDADVATAREVTGKAKLVALLESMQGAGEAADPTLTTGQETSSPRSLVASSESSSPPSLSSSATREDQPAPIGTGG